MGVRRGDTTDSTHRVIVKGAGDGGVWVGMVRACWAWVVAGQEDKTPHIRGEGDVLAWAEERRRERHGRSFPISLPDLEGIAVDLHGETASCISSGNES